MVYNPKWLQAIFYVGIAGFPCLSGYMFYLAFEVYLKTGISSAAVFVILGIGVSYISYIGLILAKFVSAKVEFSDDEFKVIMKNNVVTYKWTDIAKAKNHQSSQILRLFDSSGNTIYIVDHMSPGYAPFAEKVNEAVGI
jgi:hypothetical protein